MSQQKDSDVEEKQKLANEREAQQKRITHMAEESAKLKTELARYTQSTHNVHNVQLVFGRHVHTTTQSTHNVYNVQLLPMRE